VSLGRDVLARMAELLRVDELAQFSTLRPTHGFALRVGSSWQKVEVEVEVDDLDFADANVSRRLIASCGRSSIPPVTCHLSNRSPNSINIESESMAPVEPEQKTLTEQQRAQLRDAGEHQTKWIHP